VATYQRSPSPEDEGEALNLWVAVLSQEGKSREALRVLERLEKLIALNLPPDHALAYRARMKRVALLSSLERDVEAVEVARQAVALGIKQRGPHHPIVAAARLALANALASLRRPAEARAELDQAEPIFRATMPDSLSMLELQAARATIEDLEGRAAASLARGLLEPLRRRAGPEHLDVVSLLDLLGDAERRLGHPDEAARALEEALRIVSKLPDRAAGARTRLALAKVLWASGQDPARAMELARAAADDTAEAGGRTHQEAQALVAAHAKVAATGPGQR
jgi:tetratricopeptide (TPR) repeat protein